MKCDKIGGCYGDVGDYIDDGDDGVAVTGPLDEDSMAVLHHDEDKARMYMCGRGAGVDE